MKDIKKYLGSPKIVNGYSSARLKDKERMLNLIAKGFKVHLSGRNHYVTIGGKTFNGFSLKEVKKMCEDLEIEYKIEENL